MRSRHLLSAVVLLTPLSQTLLAQADFPGFLPGNPVVSRSLYTGTAAAVTVGQKLPPTCPATATCPTATATNDGTYPNVWLNAKVDGSFGITTPIFLDQISTEGALINTYAVPPSVLVISFLSKSEVGLNLSPESSVLTFMGYFAPPLTLNVSNSNTRGVVDPTNPVGTNFYRAIAQVYPSGAIQITNTNAYSGNNAVEAKFATSVGGLR